MENATNEDVYDALCQVYTDFEEELDDDGNCIKSIEIGEYSDHVEVIFYPKALLQEFKDLIHEIAGEYVNINFVDYPLFTRLDVSIMTIYEIRKARIGKLLLNI
ncbi:hypothetical protein [Rufibacter soli]